MSVNKPTTFTRKQPAAAAGGQSSSSSPITPSANKLPGGCKLSLQNGNLLTSTGLGDLDDILGGGIPIGSILMVEEDINSSFYMFLLKYFLAEGITQHHGVFFSSLIGHDAFDILNKLPARMTRQEELDADTEEQSNQRKQHGGSGGNSGSDDLKIAWRYQNYIDAENAKKASGATQQQNQSSPFCHAYDFTRKMNIQSIDPNHLHTLSYTSQTQSESSSPYRSLYMELQQLVQKYNQSASQGGPINESTKILRLALQSFASPLWSNDEEGVIEFLHSLKGLLRSSVSVCVITVPTYIYSESFVKKISHMCDTVVSINSFSGMGSTPEAFQEYLGMFTVKKIARLNTLAPSFNPDMLSFVFKMRRRTMAIEKISLQPEFSRSGDSSSSDQQDKTKSKKEDIVSKMKSGSGLLCGAGGPKSQIGSSPLDF
ncbi:RNA polymerase II elongator complex subunit [Cavenderia fasciculata]|uniref:Elongator complex protein 4 n=1 Tax=Cavenderia fasciculata TaxID=261658 RepID=F4QD41_CACFS|nr:RNA polymerase II elongator complex subunit [Cavenderia fasciculata]EGG14512.1 RNA polymerase II elongator complex subunit [Cavenderia fasciculata]|eukprot:XP_004353927.1 RNA polymerase II elongator complex subunit [Cavenderia fasciculata]